MFKIILSTLNFKKYWVQKISAFLLIFVPVSILIVVAPSNATANPQELVTEQSRSATQITSTNESQNFNFHVQNTDILQWHPPFPAAYSGPHSLKNISEDAETVNLDIFLGFKLWHGGALHLDGLMWQGQGLSGTLGIEDFPNGDAFKSGTKIPNFSFAHLFIRQTFGLGGKQENIKDGQLTLAGKQDISHLTFMLGRMTPLDIFDHNTYADNPNTQFLNWATMSNMTFDYGQDTIGYETGFMAELNQPKWALRYGFFPMPQYTNYQNIGSGNGGDDELLTWPASGAYLPLLKSWNQAVELELRYRIQSHSGTVRLLAWLTHSYMDSYTAATTILLTDGPNANIAPAEAWHYAYGFGLNWEQEIKKGIGLFSRLGWNDGQTQALEFTDANWTASLGLSLNGAIWDRTGDSCGVAEIISGASLANQRFLEAGGLGILAGDGTLTYGPENVVEVYYNCKFFNFINITLDGQYVTNPAFNQARGPVPVFAVRTHWSY